MGNNKTVLWASRVSDRELATYYHDLLAYPNDKRAIEEKEICEKEIIHRFLYANSDFVQEYLERERLGLNDEDE